MNALVASTDIVVKADITNISDEENIATLIVALFDSNNTMINFVRIQWNAKAGENRVLEAGFKLPQNTEGHTLKAFVWDSMENMNPISNVEVLE